eukprot:160073_1
MLVLSLPKHNSVQCGLWHLKLSNLVNMRTVGMIIESIFGKSPYRLLTEIVKKTPLKLNKFSDKIQDFVNNKCLQRKPSSRCSAATLLQHSWFKNDIDHDEDDEKLLHSEIEIQWEDLEEAPFRLHLAVKSNFCLHRSVTFKRA